MRPKSGSMSVGTKAFIYFGLALLSSVYVIQRYIYFFYQKFSAFSNRASVVDYRLLISQSQIILLVGAAISRASNCIIHVRSHQMLS